MAKNKPASPVRRWEGRGNPFFIAALPYELCEAYSWARRCDMVSVNMLYRKGKATIILKFDDKSVDRWCANVGDIFIFRTWKGWVKQ